MPSRLSSPITARPNALRPPLRGASVAEFDPVERLVVAERHQPHAGRVPDPQRAQRILESDSALDRDERGDFSERLGLGVVRSAPRGKEDVRVRLLDAPDEIDLLERRSGGMGGAGRLERGKELGSDHPLAQARNVGVGVRMHPVELVGDHVAPRGLVDPDHPRQVVVPVEQRRAPEHRAGRRQRIVHNLRGGGRLLRHAGRRLSSPATRRNERRLRRWRREAAPASCRSPSSPRSIALATSRGVSTA